MSGARETSDHAAAAGRFLADPERVAWHDRAVWHVRSKRDLQAYSRDSWEELRDQASAVKRVVLGDLAALLEEFERRAEANGIRVHWARDAAECNTTVGRLFEERGVRRVVKSKSMLSEECGLNPFLESRGISVTDTDLGERIVQLRREPPTHIVLPAIHLRREEVGQLFHDALGSPEGESDPGRLTAIARNHLRERFQSAEASISGANFLLADSGGIVVCTNEGNFDLAFSLAPLHVVCVGIEKVLPSLSDLPLFLRLLARSATGQPITVYTSHLQRPRPGQEVHVVLVDNRRTEQLARPEFRMALSCIRCGACLNTCPIFRRGGGASYGWAIGGPIGSILAPLRDPEKYSSLPFASSLCGSCSAVCPVKIPIHEQLLAWRGELVAKRIVPWRKRFFFALAAAIVRRPPWYRVFSRMGRQFLRRLPRWALYHRWNVWGAGRELPEAASESFHEWYRRTHR